MDREQAIETLRANYPDACYEQLREAVDAAIEALKAQLSQQGTTKDAISRQAVIDALHTWFRDGFDEDKWWNSTHVLAAIEGLPPVQPEQYWETCFECPLSHGCPKIKGCTNEQAIEYASQIPNDCPLSAQPNLQPTCNQLATDCISRQKAIDALNEYFARIGKLKRRELTEGEKAISLDTVGTIKTLPPAQPEPHEGHWIEGRIYRDVIECNCSECGQLMTTAATVRMNYCPKCGAHMKGE